MLKQFAVPEDIAIRVPFTKMRSAVQALFLELGMNEGDAIRSTDTLLYADVRGIDSHGVSNMLRVYVAGIQSGDINPRPKWKIEREFPATATVDTDQGLGVAVGPELMELAIEKARVHGVGTVIANNGRHFGAAAYHAQLALDHNMIGLSMTVGGLSVVPTFGAEARVGLNPLAIAVPTDKQPAFIFDASMSSVAGNKVRLAQRLGEPMLPGWVAEADGTPIMESKELPEDFLILPLGGTREIGSHKGYSLAASIDILAGVLSTAGSAFQRSEGNGRGIGHHFTAFNVEAFGDLAEFKANMDEYLVALQETPTAPGHDRVIYAGIEEHEQEIDRKERGIPYHPEVVEWFESTFSELGMSNLLS